MNLIENKITINGLSINYVEAGEGQPIIFMHNGGGFWHSWEHQIKHFSKDYKVYGIDWPGFGKSDLPDGFISLELLTNTLTKFIQLKKLTNIILIGNCIGGSAALQYNINNPEMVNKLIIFNICPGNLIFRLPVARRLIKSLNQKEKSKSFVSKLLIFSFLKTPIKRQFPKMLFGKNTNQSSSLYLRYVEKFREGSQTKSRVNMVFSVHTFNLVNYLKGTAPKHLLVWGNQNRVTSLKDHGYLHKEMLQPSQFKIIENAGHLCMYEKPDEINQLIVNYLNS